jgi:hypothetical protein
LPSIDRRVVRPEILDDLPAEDPRAARARRDLRIINVLMGHPRLVVRALRDLNTLPRRIVELGGGDGTLLLRVARALGPAQQPVRAVLVDRRPAVAPATETALSARGWHVEVTEADVCAWLERPDLDVADVTIANLFLHHFEDTELRRLLELVSRQTRCFIACEPSRSRAGLAGVSLMRLAGFSDVTRHDGRISVCAGFRDREISALWPSSVSCTVTERSVAPFSHLFIARR